jgi:hypothetical protein
VRSAREEAATPDSNVTKVGEYRRFDSRKRQNTNHAYSALLESQLGDRAIWTRKLSNNAEGVALTSIQGEGLTIRSKTEPESVKLVL